MTRRVIPLPWWPCQLGCGQSRVVLWRGRAVCRCQMSYRDRYLVGHDTRLDGEDAALPRLEETG